jgi:ribosome biogenesis GTPase
VTKTDLADAAGLIDDYRRAGYPAFAVDPLHGDVSGVAALIEGKLCVLSGNTGVGKSTLLNALDPRLGLSTGETSKKLGRGRHTTRTTEIFPVCGGMVADTPGFSALDVESVEPIPKEKLELCFPEFAPYLLKCRFTGCSHTKEKGCAVLAALEAGDIAQSRHRSYCALYEEAKNRKEWED